MLSCGPWSTFQTISTACQRLGRLSAALALLRHLTNPRILGDAALDGAGAWRALQAWLAVPRVAYLGEPAGVDELLGRWSGELDVRGGRWTDAYLAAFAAASNSRLVAFDGDFQRYPGVEFLHLRP
jgi:predicted nucleic acid-binding protein